MPRTLPLPDWHGEDVFLIGGGASLEHFNWEQLIGLNTIGCNQAFTLGECICNICLFGDNRFWQAYLQGQFDLSSYGGWVATNYRVLRAPEWLHVYPREHEGLSTTAIAWNGNTGAAAVNLALLLGAQRVFLLGYDMNRTPEKSHWHNLTIEKSTMEHYDRFNAGFVDVADSLPKVFPGREVVNVTDGRSRLTCLPQCSFEDIGFSNKEAVHA